MAKQLTPLERKKRNQRLMVISGVIAFLAVAVLLIGLQREPAIEEGARIDTEATRQAAQAIIRDVTIPQEFFEEDLLENFIEYTPIASPSSWGREDPFILF